MRLCRFCWSFVSYRSNWCHMFYMSNASLGCMGPLVPLVLCALLVRWARSTSFNPNKKRASLFFQPDSERASSFQKFRDAGARLHEIALKPMKKSTIHSRNANCIFGYIFLLNVKCFKTYFQNVHVLFGNVKYLRLF